MAATFDVAIIGGGIVGAACAYSLRGSGLKIAVIECECEGSGATSAGMGHVVAMDDSPAQLALTRYSQTLWRDLASELPAECEYEHRGTVWVAEDEEELTAAREKAATFAEHGIPAEVLDERTLAQKEPALRSGLSGALFVPEDGVLYAPAAARWLLERSGAELVHARVSAIDRGTLRLQSGEELAIGWSINAAGSDAQRLTKGLKLFPKKGHLVITDRYPGTVDSQILELGYIKSAHGHEAQSVAFNVQPRATGQLLIGSSRQVGHDDKSVHRGLVAKMVRRALSFMPVLSKVHAVRTWTGIRSTTADNLPIVGPSPEDPKQLLAVGHEGLGVTTSLGVGALIASYITGSVPLIDPEPYAAHREAVFA